MGAGIWVWDAARAWGQGTCCWRSPWAVSGGWAQLHPSAASRLLPSGVKFQPRRHRIPGWGPECPHPALPFKAHLAAPPGKIQSPPSHPLARLRPPRRRGGGWEVENTGQSEEPGRLRGTESGRSEFVDTRSRELGGWAEGGSGRGEAGPCLGPLALWSVSSPGSWSDCCQLSGPLRFSQQTHQTPWAGQALPWGSQGLPLL